MHLTVFRNRKRADMDAAAYEADTKQMYRLASAFPGFISIKAYVAEDGEVVSLTEWVDEQSARDWGAHEEHRAVQGKGRAEYYESYTLFACNDPRISHFNRREN
jgi:heme-degrading monooxygenase HmoA